MTPSEAARNINNPEVQEMVKRLSSFGLGVSLPHGHNHAGDIVHLGHNQVLVPTGEKVVSLNDDYGEPVAWRWDDDKQVVVVAMGCHGGNCD